MGNARFLFSLWNVGPLTDHSQSRRNAVDRVGSFLACSSSLSTVLLNVA